MRNGARPKLIILYGERDTGKTTLLHFVVPRGLSKRYRGRVVSCSADRRAVEAGPDENDEQIRLRLARKVFKRIIDESNVPGDIGEGTAAMRDAIAKHFLREDQP